jgi:hypothetical protein
MSSSAEHRSQRGRSPSVGEVTLDAVHLGHGVLAVIHIYRSVIRPSVARSVAS